MTVCFAFCTKDATLLERLLEWIGQLGTQHGNHCVLVVDGAVGFETVMAIKAKAANIFSRVTVFCSQPVDGWIRGSNTLFQLAATKLIDRPFLWLEPDAVPTRASWLDEIESLSLRFPDKFIGAIVHHEAIDLPNPYLEGCAVYPPRACDVMKDSFNFDQSWTLACAKAVVPHALNSPLFQHFWGKPGIVPTFVRDHTPDVPINGLPLSHVRKETALFHRNKDGSLIRLLRQKIFPVQERIIVVFPVCAMDIQLALLHATWLQRMRHKSEHQAVISCDASLPSQTVKRLADLLRASFASVEQFQYATPRVRYPHAANIAWQNTARHMQSRGCPWFWCEADGVALKPDWIEQLQAEYTRGAKPWMGVIVPHMGHLQGTAIYPADAASRMRKAMESAAAQAFDMEGKSDVNGQVHDASKLLFHVWSVENGNPLPVGGGELPRGITADQLRQWLPKSAVYMHRIKDASVLTLLMSGAYAH